MTQEEELQALREENRTLKALVAELLPLKEQLAQANARIKELEDRVAKDSRTSSKPPSSDGLARLPRRSRRSSGKRPGGQAGHPGQTLTMVERPDEVVRHRPKMCSQCRKISVMFQAGLQNVVKFSTCLPFACWHPSIRSKPFVAPPVTPQAWAAFPPRSTRQSNTAPTCRRWPCICIRGNCSPPLAPARLLLRSVDARSRKEP